MSNLLTRIFRWLINKRARSLTLLGLISEPGADSGFPRDPYSRKPAPVRRGPKTRSGAAAVAEPDE